MNKKKTRKPKGLEAFFVDLAECKCNMTIHLYLKLDKRPSRTLLNSTMRRMLCIHPDVNLKYKRKKWYPSDYVPECQIVEVDGDEVYSPYPVKMDYRKNTIALNIIHATKNDEWHLCFDFFHGAYDGLSGVQFVYDFFALLNGKELGEIESTLNCCQIVEPETKKHKLKPAFTIWPKCSLKFGKVTKNFGEKSTVFRTEACVRSVAAKLSNTIGDMFSDSSAKMIVPVDVRRYSDIDKAMFGNLFVPVFLEAKSTRTLDDLRGEIKSFVENKNELMSIARKLKIYSRFPSWIRRAVIRFFKPIVLSHKKFIYCALVSSFGKIDSEKLKCAHFNTTDFVVTGGTFPFTALTAVSVQFEGHTNTIITWDKGRMIEESANTLVEKIKCEVYKEKQ